MESTIMPHFKLKCDECDQNPNTRDFKLHNFISEINPWCLTKRSKTHVTRNKHSTSMNIVPKKVKFTSAHSAVNTNKHSQHIQDFMTKHSQKTITLRKWFKKVKMKTLAKQLTTPQGSSGGHANGTEKLLKHRHFQESLHQINIIHIHLGTDKVKKCLPQETQQHYQNGTTKNALATPTCWTGRRGTFRQRRQELIWRPGTNRHGARAQAVQAALSELEQKEAHQAHTTALGLSKQTAKHGQKAINHCQQVIDTAQTMASMLKHEQ